MSKIAGFKNIHKQGRIVYRSGLNNESNENLRFDISQYKDIYFINLLINKDNILDF